MTNATYPNFARDLAFSMLNSVSRASGWAFSKFMIAPMQNLGVFAISAAIVFSASNALFWQTTTHPSPMFSESPQGQSVQIIGEIVPGLSAPNPLELAVARASAPNSQESTAPVPLSTANRTAVETVVVTHETLVQAQEVLSTLGFFDGKVDGFYGPLTAEAIRSFELQRGLPAKGAITPEIITIILNGPALSSASVPATSMPTTSPALDIIEPNQALQILTSSSQVISSEQALPQVLPTLSAAPRQERTTQDVAVASAQTLTVSAPLNPLIDKVLIEKIQRGLSSLGFYYNAFDGVAGVSTARAIREFENFQNIAQTGLVSEELLEWLISAGARIE